jgi:hypothetical protein
MKRLLVLFGIVCAVPLIAQPSNPSVRYVGSAPSGSCPQAPPIRIVNSTGTVYTCDNGTWAAIGGGGGSGTVNPGTTGQVAYYPANGSAVSGTTALPNGTTATTQSAVDGSTKIATDQFVQENLPPPSTTLTMNNSGTGDPSGTVFQPTSVNPRTLSYNTIGAAPASAAACMTPVTVTLASPGIITFSSIPQTCNTLVIDWSGISNNSGATDALNLIPNSNATSNVSWWQLYAGCTSTTSAATNVFAQVGNLDYSGQAQALGPVSGGTVVITGYSSTANRKQFWDNSIRNNVNNGPCFLYGGAIWGTTSAITNIVLEATSATSNFLATGFTATLSGR